MLLTHSLGNTLVINWLKSEVGEYLHSIGINTPYYQAEAVGIDGTDSQAAKTTKERDLTRWFRETWINEGRLGASLFFMGLKKYVNKRGSPIKEYFTTSQAGAGVRVANGKIEKGMTKKAIQNMVDKFKRTP